MISILVRSSKTADSNIVHICLTHGTGNLWFRMTSRIAMHFPGIAMHFPGIAMHFPGIAMHFPGIATQC